MNLSCNLHMGSCTLPLFLQAPSAAALPDTSRHATRPACKAAVTLLSMPTAGLGVCEMLGGAAQVCQRMGLRMAACPLEGGRYFILWPKEAPLRSCGAEFVIDAYSKGEVFLLDEVRYCASDQEAHVAAVVRRWQLFWQARRKWKLRSENED